MYAHKGRTKKLKLHGLQGFALDQPSINGFGPINRSEKMKRSETVGNGRQHDQAKTCQPAFLLKINISAQHSFFFEGPKVSKGKRLETVGDRTFGPSTKKNCVARKCLFLKEMRVDKFWPDHVADRFRPFPTVSDCFRLFHFF